MNPVDSLGNPLNEKDLVVVHMAASVLKAVVTKLKEASVIMGKENQPQPGMLTLTIELNIPFMPDHAGRTPRMADLFKVVKPPNFNQQPS